MKIRRVAPILLASALLLTACGDDGDESTEAEEHSSTPAEAVTEAKATQQGLTQAMTTYKGGDQAAAAEQVSETYLQHFELVEGPLEEVDAELNEELEHGIREDLTASMEAGDPVPQVQAQVDELNQQLTTAIGLLGGK